MPVALRAIQRYELRLARSWYVPSAYSCSIRSRFRVKYMANALLGRGDLLLIVFGDVSPTQEDWDEHLEFFSGALERRPYQSMYCLAYSLGGGPNARQRQELVDATPTTKRGRAAVLARSPAARGMASALSWIYKPELRVFGLRDLEPALEWLGIKSVSAETVREEIDCLLTQLG